MPGTARALPPITTGRNTLTRCWWFDPLADACSTRIFDFGGWSERGLKVSRCCGGRRTPELQTSQGSTSSPSQWRDEAIIKTFPAAVTKSAACASPGASPRQLLASAIWCFLSKRPASITTARWKRRERQKNERDRRTRTSCRMALWRGDIISVLGSLFLLQTPVGIHWRRSYSTSPGADLSRPAEKGKAQPAKVLRENVGPSVEAQGYPHCVPSRMITLFWRFGIKS